MKATRSVLIGFRKQHGLSQQELGRRVAYQMGLGWSDVACQKRISNWESGSSEPNEQERSALAKVLGVTREQIDANLGKTSQDSIFHWLARDDAEPSFVGICCTSGPREIHDMGMLSSLQKGIAAGKISVAMFIPGNRIPDTGIDSGILNGHIAGVEKDVIEYYRCLVASSKDTCDRVQVYQPTINLSMPFPPMMSCNYLIAYRDRGTVQSRVYFWVRTARFDDLMLVDADHTPRTSIWQHYFDPVFSTWYNKKVLSSGGGFWKSTPIAKL